MDLLKAVNERHSVRAYTDKRIEGEVKDKLQSFIAQCNEESGLHIQLVLDEPNAFDNFLAHYGKFSGVRNYISLVGKKSSDLDEKCGYYGEKIVLYAQTLGLNTCWAGISYRRKNTVFKLNDGEKLCIVISLGYGVNQGSSRKSKTREDVMKVKETPPDWFIDGIDAALLAPTAVNQQKFTFILDGSTVHAKAGLGFFSKVDLGIVKYHFEIGAGRDNFEWK